MDILKNKKNNGKFARYLNDRKNKISISGISINFDWYFILVLSFIIFILFMFNAWSTYSNVEEDLMAMEEAGGQQSLTIHEEKLEAVLSDLGERRTIRSITLTAPEFDEESDEEEIAESIDEE